MDNKESLTIKNPDGSVLVMKVSDITDPKVKKEMEDLKSYTNIKVKGEIIKKK